MKFQDDKKSTSVTLLQREGYSKESSDLDDQLLIE